MVVVLFSKSENTIMDYKYYKAYFNKEETYIQRNMKAILQVAGYPLLTLSVHGGRWRDRCGVSFSSTLILLMRAPHS